MRYIPPPAGSRIIERILPTPGNNVSRNPGYVEPAAGPGPQTIDNPFVKPEPTPAIQQAVTQKITGGNQATTDADGVIRDASGMQISTGPTKQLGPGITATPAVLPPGWQPAQEVSRFSMPFPGVKLNRGQQQELNARSLAEQMGLQSQLLAGEQRRDPDAFSQAYGGAINQAAQALLPSEAESRLTEQDLLEEASQRKRLQDYGKLPSTTSQGLQDAYRQHYQQYPWAQPGQERPKTRAEVMREIGLKEEQQYQLQLAEFSTRLGLPPIPMRRNERGQLEPAVSIDNLIAQHGAQQRSAAADQRNLAETKYRARVEALKAIKPDGSSPKDMAAYQKAIVKAHNDYVRDLDGGEAEPEPPASPEENNRMAVPPKQLETAKQQASAAGVPMVVSQDDFDALEPGEIFVDAADGQTYRK